MAKAPKLMTSLSRKELSDLTQAKREMSAKFLKASRAAPLGAHALRIAAAPGRNVVGVGVDEKYVSGTPTGISAVKFLVRKKLTESDLSPSERLPKTVAGLPTDVEEVGQILPQAAPLAVMPNPRRRSRPAKPGCSIGFREPSDLFIMAGTLGALVKDRSGRKYVLSNNHVLAYESGVLADGTRRRALPIGAPIFQPGLLDDGSIATGRIAKLTRWVDLRADVATNRVDAAIAEVRSASTVSRDVLFIGAPTGTSAAAVDMVVHKFGRTTSYRVGIVTSLFFDLTVPYEVGDVKFIDQLAIRGLHGGVFSSQGDSGSAILERGTNKVVGLLFAGTQDNKITFANPIDVVLRKLRVRLA